MQLTKVWRQRKVLRDITGLFAFNASQIATNPVVEVDSHSKEDAIWVMVVNASNSSFTITDREGIIFGYVPRYSMVPVYFPKRDMAIQFNLVTPTGSAVNNNAPGKVWVGFDKIKLADTMPLAF